MFHFYRLYSFTFCMFPLETEEIFLGWCKKPTSLISKIPKTMEKQKRDEIIDGLKQRIENLAKTYV